MMTRLQVKATNYFFCKKSYLAFESISMLFFKVSTQDDEKISVTINKKKTGKPRQEGSEKSEEGLNDDAE